MPRLHCHRCGLTLEVRYASLSLEYCPRCLARARIASPMAAVDAVEASRAAAPGMLRRRAPTERKHAA